MSGARSKAKGTRVELKARRLLEDWGMTVIRAAGSHGAVDLVAVDVLGVKLVQVKGGVAPRARPREVNALLGLAQVCPKGVSVELWLWRDGEKQPVRRWFTRHGEGRA